MVRSTSTDGSLSLPAEIGGDPIPAARSFGMHAELPTDPVNAHKADARKRSSYHDC